MNPLKSLKNRLINPSVSVPLSLKFAVTFTVLLTVTVLFIVIFVRMTVVRQFTRQYQQQVQTSLRSIQQKLQNRQETIDTQLNQFAQKLRGDYDFRLQASVLNNVHQRFIVDYAGNYMSAMGLQALEITDKSGTIISSGHYRNAFGGSTNWLFDQMRRPLYADTVVIAQLSRPTGHFLSIVTLDSVILSDKKFYLLGGMEITADLLRNLQPQPRMSLLLLQTNKPLISSQPDLQPNLIAQLTKTTPHTGIRYARNKQYTLAGFSLPYFTRDNSENVRLVMIYPTNELHQLLASVNRKILLIAGLSLLAGIVIMIWRTNSVTQPLQRLTNTASRLSLDTLNIRFDEQSNDEIGILNETLQNMVQRLKENRLKLMTVEQKAALAEIARQVNHDIKNGFIPIRNVMEHWQEVESESPEELPQIFRERKQTILESLDYLENLTKNYARLRPELNWEAVDIHQLLVSLVASYQNYPGKSIDVSLIATEERLTVYADYVQLKRVFENIVKNAVEAIESEGKVTIETERINGDISIVVTDNGSGIPENIREQLFHATISTKPGGSGLGLANVKRIISDFDGTVSLSSEPGHGTAVTIILPEFDNSADIESTHKPGQN